MEIKKSLLTPKRLIGGITRILLIAEIILLTMTCYSIYLSCQYVAKQKEYIQIYEDLNQIYIEQIQTEEEILLNLYTQLEQIQ